MPINLKLIRRLRSEDPFPASPVVKFHLSKEKNLGIMSHACHPRSGRKLKNRRIAIQASLSKKRYPSSKK
jgi:hypothetical protein